MQRGLEDPLLGAERGRDRRPARGQPTAEVHPMPPGRRPPGQGQRGRRQALAKGDVIELDAGDLLDAQHPVGHLELEARVAGASRQELGRRLGEVVEVPSREDLHEGVELGG